MSKAPDFDFAIVTQWILQFALFGSLFLVPQFLESIRGYSALDTGLSLLPQALGAAIFMPLGGALFDRIGARPLLLVGGVLMVIAGFLLAGVNVHSQGRDLILPLFLYGTGMGLSFMSLNTQTINAAPRSLVGRVTALTNAFQQVVNALTIALLTTFLTSRPTYTSAQLLLTKAEAAAAAHTGHVSHAAGPAPTGLPAPIATLFSHAFDDTFTFMAIMAVIAGLLGLTLRRKTAAQRAAVLAGEDTATPEVQMMAG